MKAIVLDTETTDTKDDASLVEAAYMEISDDHYPIGNVFCQRYNPGRPISLGAMAIHHIHDSDLVDCPPSSEFNLPEDVDYLIGHNIDFDWRVIGLPDIPRICTLALARSLWPDIDSHSQSALMYYHLGVEARDKLKNAHSAGADVVICHQILGFIVMEISRRASTDETHANFLRYQELWQVSEAARIPKVMPFGKHKGAPISQVPQDYIRWLLRQNDIDPYLVKAINQR